MKLYVHLNPTACGLVDHIFLSEASMREYQKANPDDDIFQIVESEP